MHAEKGLLSANSIAVLKTLIGNTLEAEMYGGHVIVADNGNIALTMQGLHIRPISRTGVGAQLPPPVRLLPIEEEAEGIIFQRLQSSHVPLRTAFAGDDEPQTYLATYGLTRFPLRRIDVWAGYVAFNYADEDAKLSPLPCDRRIDFISSLPSGAEIGMTCEWGRNRKFFVYALGGRPGAPVEDWAVHNDLERRLMLKDD